MSLEYFEGPAGSGKTFNLIEALKRLLAAHPMSESEAVLGVTYLHGSRRRMHRALSRIPALKRRFHACTIDSLVRSVVCRWRSLGMEMDAELNLRDGAPEFQRICKVGATLIEKPLVGRWLAARYPVVLVDELQDCHGDQLRVIRAIEKWTHTIAAADEFQDLSTTGASEAVEWLHGTNGTRTVLTGNQRTTQQVLLRAAGELRGGCDCGDILGYRVCGAKNANTGAGAVARGLAYNGTRDVVILTPTGPETSPFVSDVVARLVARSIQPVGVKVPVGPFRIEWELTNETEKRDLLAKLGDTSSGVDLNRLACLSTAGQRDAGHELLEWAKKQHSLKGVHIFSEARLNAAADKILQSRRAFLPDRPLTTIRAMTVNQAKNREFDGVVVLWPFAIGGNLPSHRRKLYNAITRAKRWACVVVQDNAVGKSRLQNAPFSKTIIASK